MYLICFISYFFNINNKNNRNSLYVINVSKVTALTVSHLQNIPIKI